MSPDLKDLKQAAVAKKYWAARESALKKQLVQDYLFRAQGQLRSNGKEHGTATFDLGDSLKVKFVLGKDRKVNADDVARVLRNRPDLAKYFQVGYTLLAKEKDLAQMDPDTRALLLECTTTTDKRPTVEILGIEDEDDTEGEDA